MKIAFVGDSYCMHAGPGTPAGEDKELALKIAETLNCKVEDLFQLPKN